MDPHVCHFPHIFQNIDAFWTVCDCKLVSLLCEVFPSLIAAAGGDSMID
jgi:hypothetical protein